MCRLSDKILFEGVYSSHPIFSEIIKYVAFLDVDKETQMERINERKLKDRFINEWIPLENKYFDHYKLEDICDVIILTYLR